MRSAALTGGVLFSSRGDIPPNRWRASSALQVKKWLINDARVEKMGWDGQTDACLAASMPHLRSPSASTTRRSKGGGYQSGLNAALVGRCSESNLEEDEWLNIIRCFFVLHLFSCARNLPIYHRPFVFERIYNRTRPCSIVFLPKIFI
jgi:hypothetical protein